MTDIRAKVRAVLLRTMGEVHLDPHEERDDARLREDLGLDSLDMVLLGNDLEIDFGIEIDDAAIENARTVGDLVRIVRELMEGAKEKSNGETKG